MTQSPFEGGGFGGLEGVPGDGVTWYAFVDGSELNVSSRDPATAGIVAEATIATPFSDEMSFVNAEVVLLGTGPQVLVSNQTWDETNQQNILHSQLYRVTGV